MESQRLDLLFRVSACTHLAPVQTSALQGQKLIQLISFSSCPKTVAVNLPPPWPHNLLPPADLQKFEG